MKKRLKSIENKVENLYHNISRMIVATAENEEASIVFEDLEVLEGNISPAVA
mgnify:CR=1 FL=1